MGCKLTSNITKEACQYSVAGVKAIYLINQDAKHGYTIDADGAISAITLDGNEKAYKIDFAQNSASFSDELAVNGNGGKYRTHTLNFTLSEYSYNVLNQGDKLSLGTFSAVVVDKSDRAIVLGRLNGMNATAFNYASGAAEADANGWTVTMAGTEKEIARLLTNASVIESVADTTVVAP